MPKIVINGGSPGVKASVSASGAISATLDTVDGIRTVEWSIVGTDETSSIASYTLVQSGSVGQTVGTTALTAGTAGILRAKWNGGIDLQTGLPDPAGTQATCKFYVPLANGKEVGCTGEGMESDSVHGSTGLINGAIRAADALSNGALSRHVRVATVTALPSNTRSGNVLTATANGALGTIDTVAVAPGDLVLVQNEGGGASHVNNGSYTFTQDGDGSHPWKLTRTTDFDESGELVPGIRFYVQEGSTYAKKERVFVTPSATINVTALAFESFAYAPNDVAYLTVGSSSLLSAEKDVTAVGSTIAFASTSTQPASFTRTDSATAATVDVGTTVALSTGTTTAGFGPAWLWNAKEGSGAEENVGRLAFAWTDVTASSEDSKLVVQARTAGAALATAFEVSGTAAKLPFLAGGGSGFVTYDNAGNLGTGSAASGTAHFWEDAPTAVNANGVATQNLAASLAVTGQAGVVPIKLSTVGVQASDTEVLRLRRTVSDASGHGGTSTLAHVAMALPNATGTETEFAEIAWQLTSTLGPSGKMVLRTLNGGTMSDWLTLANDGAIRFHGAAYAHNGYRLVLDGSGNVSASVITFSEVNAALATANATIAINGQTITLCAGIDRAAASIAIGGSATDLSFDSTAGTETHKAGGTSTRVDTFSGAGTSTVVWGAGTTISESQTQHASAAGNTRTLTGQQGASGFAGGKLRFVTGTGGDASHLSGDYELDLGAKVSQATAAFRLQTNGTNFGVHDVNANFYRIQNDATGSGTGIWITASGIIQLQSTGITSIQSTGSDVWIQSATATLDLYKNNTLAAVLTYDPTAAQSLAMQVRSSTGANAGVTLTISAQPGQAQTGGANNNNGGDLALQGGAAGTGGGGSAGSRGNVLVTASNFNIQSDGAYRGPLGVPTTLKTSAYTASFFEVVRYDPGGGAFTIKLPDPVAADAGKVIWLKNEGSSTTTLTLTTVSGAVNIDDATSKSLTTAWLGLMLICTGTNGYIMFPHS